MVGLILLMLGCLAFMVWSIYMATDINRFRQCCEKTIGVMSDYVVRYDEDDDERYVGVFSYEVDGACYEVEEADWHLFEPELGETATIYYDPQHPSKARFQISGLGVIMFCGGRCRKRDVWNQGYDKAYS